MPLRTTESGKLMPSTASVCTSNSEIIPPHLLHPPGPSFLKSLGSKMVMFSSLSIILAILRAKMLKKEPVGPPPMTEMFAPSSSIYGLSVFIFQSGVITTLRESFASATSPKPFWISESGSVWVIMFLTSISPFSTS